MPRPTSATSTPKSTRNRHRPAPVRRRSSRRRPRWYSPNSRPIATSNLRRKVQGPFKTLSNSPRNSASSKPGSQALTVRASSTGLQCSRRRLPPDQRAMHLKQQEQSDGQRGEEAQHFFRARTENGGSGGGESQTTWRGRERGDSR